MNYINETVEETIDEVTNFQYTLTNLRNKLSKLSDDENYLNNINKKLQNIEKLSLLLNYNLLTK